MQPPIIKAVVLSGRMTGGVAFEVQTKVKQPLF